MKIIGGQYRGRNFYMPKDIRPTQSVAREALFDIMGQELTGLSFIDNFAGSGAMGLEALSRGATETVFVEKEPKFADLIRENVGLLNIDHLARTVNIEVLCADSFASIKALAVKGRHFDIVFVDPPYHRELGKKALKTLDAHDIVHPNSTLIIQHDTKEILPEMSGRFLLFRKKKYGNSYFSIYHINN